MSNNTIRNPLAYLKPNNLIKAAVILTGACAAAARPLASDSYSTAPSSAPALAPSLAPAPMTPCALATACTISSAREVCAANSAITEAQFAGQTVPHSMRLAADRALNQYNSCRDAAIETCTPVPHVPHNFCEF